MKRSKRVQKTKSKKKTPAAAVAQGPEISRRDMLGKLKRIGIGVALVGGGGFFAVRSVKASMYEHDLTRIGKGVPMVVQIHDPQCPSCLALQRNVRKAMRGFGDDELQYAVANITEPKGRSLALDHDAQHITLLLFDGDGNRQSVLTGIIDSAVLEQRFSAHAKQYSGT